MKKAIENRVSVRSYEKKALTKNDITKVNEILQFVEKKQGPFENSVRFFSVEKVEANEKKYGTYGFVKNPPAFIGGIVKNNLKGMVDFGFLFEEIILKLTELNLGTVWLGGTFKRKDFDVEVGNDEIIAAVSPVGYVAHKSINEKVIRGITRANKRKDFDELFFMGYDLKQIDKNHKYYSYLQAVQAGPSASNKQPWRIVLIDDTFHFYLQRTKGYGKTLDFDIQAIDIGIALSHLYLTLKEDHYKPIFEDKKLLELKDAEYIISIKNNKA